MTLKEQIAADTEGVFLNEDDFAEAGKFFPGGDRNFASSEDVVAVVDREAGEQPTERLGFSGQGEFGQEKRSHATVEVPASLVVDDQATPAGYFQFTVNGEEERWVVKRVLGSDEAMQTILCVRTDKVTERRPRKRG